MLSFTWSCVCWVQCCAAEPPVAAVLFAVCSFWPRGGDISASLRVDHSGGEARGENLLVTAVVCSRKSNYPLSPSQRSSSVRTERLCVLQELPNEWKCIAVTMPRFQKLSCAVGLSPFSISAAKRCLSPSCLLLPLQGFQCWAFLLEQRAVLELCVAVGRSDDSTSSLSATFSPFILRIDLFWIQLAEAPRYPQPCVGCEVLTLLNEELCWKALGGVAALQKRSVLQISISCHLTSQHWRSVGAFFWRVKCCIGGWTPSLLPPAVLSQSCAPKAMEECHLLHWRTKRLIAPMGGSLPAHNDCFVKQKLQPLLFSSSFSNDSTSEMLWRSVWGSSG